MEASKQTTIKLIFTPNELRKFASLIEDEVHTEDGVIETYNFDDGTRILIVAGEEKYDGPKLMRDE